MKTIVILGITVMYLTELCQGLSIDVMEGDSTDCLHPPVQIICKATIQELQDAGNQLTITHGGLTLATCATDTKTCTTASRSYNVTVEGTRAILTIHNMDVFYDSNTWSCDVGSKTASLKLKYFRAQNDDFSKQFLSLRQISIVDVLILLVVVGILILIILQMLCRLCCKRTTQKESKNDVECCSCFGNCFAKKIEEKTGYTGKKYDVKTSYIIEDPNHIPDAKFKDGMDRKTEAERACKNVSPTEKEKIKGHLTDYVEARKPLMSTDGTDNKS